MTRQDDEAIGALEAATRALHDALSRQPEPDVERATAALEARREALASIATSDPRTRSPEQAERLVRVLERDVEMSRTLEAHLTGIRDRLAALERLSRRLNEERAAGTSTTSQSPAADSQGRGVSAEEAARTYGRTPTT